MDQETTRAFTRLASMLLETQAQLHTANLLVGFLLKQQGFSHEEFEELRREKEEQFLERALLDLSDQGQDFVRQIDVRGLLRKYDPPHFSVPAA
ncbi:MAG TPA: hypothetical protein VG796_29210 [Verrucomicrobiales bacterium]|jgi:hypothetical protein|nr:hypothetical protein [Verrucomicrobiales bacterium]